MFGRHWFIAPIPTTWVRVSAFHSLWVGNAGGELLRSSPSLAGASVLSASRFEPLVISFSRSVQVDHRHCRPAANETMLDLRRAVGTEVVHWLGANKPAYKLDPGFLEHPRLSPRAVIGPGARFLDFSRPRHKHIEPRSRYRREFVAWPEQVSFFLEPG